MKNVLCFCIAIVFGNTAILGNHVKYDLRGEHLHCLNQNTMGFTFCDDSRFPTFKCILTVSSTLNNVEEIPHPFVIAGLRFIATVFVGKIVSRVADDVYEYVASALKPSTKEHIINNVSGSSCKDSHVRHCAICQNVSALLTDFDEINITEFNNRLDAIEITVVKLGDRMDVCELKLVDIVGAQDMIEAEMQKLSNRVDIVENKIENMESNQSMNSYFKPPTKRGEELFTVEDVHGVYDPQRQEIVVMYSIQNYNKEEFYFADLMWFDGEMYYQVDERYLKGDVGERAFEGGAGKRIVWEIRQQNITFLKGSLDNAKIYIYSINATDDPILFKELKKQKRLSSKLEREKLKGKTNRRKYYKVQIKYERSLQQSERLRR